MGKLRRPKAASASAREFFLELRRLHLHAGEPSMRDLARRIGGRRVSHTTVHGAFTGPGLPKWGVAELLGKQLGADIGVLKTLWLRAREAEDPEPTTVPEDVEADQRRISVGAVPFTEVDEHAYGAVESAYEPRRSFRVAEGSGLLLLSPAERRVALAVATGLTNSQAADHLHVSRHTVDAHLRQIFLKLGIVRRTELASLVARDAYRLGRGAAGSFGDDPDDGGAAGVPAKLP
jgi:DNA-binding CsgD family transcriptional regulator